MEINGYWLAASIIALILIIELVVKFEDKDKLDDVAGVFIFLTAMAIVFMGLAFGGR